MSEYIMGKNTIAEVLKYKENHIIEVFTSKERNDPLIQEFLKKNIPIRFVNKSMLTSMVKSESHQNIVAKTKSRNYFDLKEFLNLMDKKSSSVVLMLDSIYDPQNLGSILRSSECFSCDGVVFSKNRGSDITPVVTKAAAGATELLNLIKVSNLATTIDGFIEHGYSILATTLDSDAKDITSFEFTDKSLIIMGSEGEGIQPILLKKSDYKIHIPMTGKLQSLNVAQATAVILSYMKFTRK
ncbi:MAG: 23S rRNA (guanosine(2251)-2'-O)-methyltransferase RlmB [Parachlamydiales bacterium]|jgi:23S rRNA (guanosine2251-2'-O)-methyltransferase